MISTYKKDYRSYIKLKVMVQKKNQSKCEVHFGQMNLWYSVRFRSHRSDKLTCQFTRSLTD